MAAQYKTQCPHCSAQFRISEQHLAQAKGQVRCGSCLKVFLATEHLVANTGAAAGTQAKAATPPPAKPAPKTAAPAAQPAAAPTPENWTLPTEDAPEKASASRWTMDDDASASSTTEADVDADETFDDFSDDEIDNAVTHATNDTSVSMGGIELSDSFMSLEGDDDERLSNESFSDMSGAGRTSQSEDTDESWADKLLEELDDDKPAAAPISAATLELSATDEEAAQEQARKNKRAKQQQAARQAAEPPLQDWAQDSGGLFGDDAFGLLDDSDSEDDEIAAIELPAAEKRSVAESLKINSLVTNTTDLLRWAALSLLMGLLFAIQYMTFNFNELARTPQWRGFYTTVCGTFGCTMPSPSDITQLHGANLVVRKHPSFASALVVDLLLVNNANYQQPFPIIELGFTNLQGGAVANRRFVPDEYLQGALAGQSTMPMNQPVHISLEILDPGEEAVNYTVRFFPTPPAGA